MTITETATQFLMRAKPVRGGRNALNTAAAAPPSRANLML